ncbi:hypothetical protein CDD82_6971 [Ophiocordyceps australis]|uniref:Lysophospholipase n=1 Tax=Ophiocordyceps australis TaxID=1399860 RepID=A0A2C5YPJ5_9HYPO|nr:hypothetical protein CDD82_6971 [Ophiocordyceps australis]
MLTGAGAVAAWDSRSDGSQDQGNLGGLLQSATYLSGLSGGGWLVGSIYTNNFTSVQDAINSPNIWQFEDSILKGKDILDDVEDKEKAGFNTSITDYWGRMLSYQLINATDGGPGFTFSSIANDPDFSSANTPLPFLVSDSRAPGETLIESNSTIFVFSPWELGSADPSLQGYVPLRYVGSRFNNGQLADNESCINGFDNAGYVMGTSSSLFNQIVLYLKDGNSQYVPKDVPKFIIDALTSLLQSLGDSDNDIADWTPNPFKGFNSANNPAANNDRLTLVDGGEDNQNVPYYPHIRIDRAVDVVFSIDSSADTTHSWPNGSSAQSTYRRSLEPVANGSSFPAVPGVDTFVNLGLNSRPTFFGCNASNMSSPTPLIVYLANYPYLYHSNISTFQLSMPNSERDAMVQNGWAVATQLNSTRDSDWPYCVGCAMLARSFDRTGTQPPQKCSDCFQRYCWNGTIDESTPQEYTPSYVGTPIKVDGKGSGAILLAPRLAPAAFVMGLALFL